MEFFVGSWRRLDRQRIEHARVLAREEVAHNLCSIIIDSEHEYAPELSVLFDDVLQARRDLSIASDLHLNVLKWIYKEALFADLLDFLWRTISFFQ